MNNDNLITPHPDPLPRGERERVAGLKLSVQQCALERAGKRAAIHQDVLAGDVAGMHRAQKRAGRAELRRLAEAPGGDRLGALARASSTVMPPFFAHTCRLEVRRSVSNVPGSMKLIVTFAVGDRRATPARNAVRPARAPDDSPARAAASSPSQR